MDLAISRSIARSHSSLLRISMLASAVLCAATLASAAPAITAEPSPLSSYCVLGYDAPAQTFQVWNTGDGTMDFTVSDSAAWLSCSPASGSSSGEQVLITVNYATGGLPLGTHNAVITITSPGASNSPLTVPVSVQVVPPSPIINLSPVTLNPTNMQGKNALPLTFDVWNTGTGTLNYTITKDVTWLSCSPASGTSSGEQDQITVNFITKTLTAGTHTATITVSDAAAANNPQTIEVTLTVDPPVATIGLTPLSMLVSCIQGSDAPNQTFQIWNAGTDVLTYTISSSAAWLQLSAYSGTATLETDTITAYFNTDTLVAGDYSATITISAFGSTNSPLTINVSLTVNPPTATIVVNPTVFTATCYQGSNPPSMSFSVSNSGTGTLDYSIVPDVTWVRGVPNAGTCTTETDVISLTFNSPLLPAGTYNGKVNVTSFGSTNGSVSIDVTLTILSPVATISVYPITLTVTCPQGTNAPSQTFEVWNSGFDVLYYKISSYDTWLWGPPYPGAVSGATHDTITVNFNTASMPKGSYFGAITVSSYGSTNGSVTITVNLAITDPVGTISTSAASLTATCVQGTNAVSQAFEVWNSGLSVLSFTINDNVAWLNCGPASGTSAGEHRIITVTFTTSTMAMGVYNGTITITSNAATNSPFTIPVQLTVTVPPAEISLSTTSLSATAPWGTVPAPASFEVWNSGVGTLTYTITDNASWLTCSPASGTSTGEHDVITVTYSTATLAVGTYNGTITVSSNGAINSPQTIAVTLVMSPPVATISASVDTLIPAWIPGNNATNQTFTITNSGTGTLNYTISDNVAWLNCVPASGSSTGEADTISVQYFATALPAGTYHGTITIRGNATNTPVTIPVILTCYDIFPPTVSITSPTTDATLVIKGPSCLLDLAGTAADTGGAIIPGGLQSVTWVNDAGGNGTCTGTDTWSVSGVVLSIGWNIITITATDPAGNEGNDSIAVFYSDDLIAPNASVSSVVLEGTVSDNSLLMVDMTINGTSIPVIGDAWVSSDISLTGPTTTVNLSAADCSGNTRQVSLDVTRN